jgi:predicted branched-subunit amino acid permease
MLMTMRNGSSGDFPFTAGAVQRGLITALPFILSNGVAGAVMGLAYRGVGLSFISALLFSVLVYSATGQAVTLGLWSASPPVAAMVVACAATNARYLIMGAHLRQLFADVPRRVMAPVLLLLADASWLMTTAEADKGRRDAGYLFGSSVPMAVGWIGGTALGYVLPIQPHGPLAVAAAFLPLAFIVSLLPTQWRGTKVLLPWTLSALTGVWVALFIGQTWAMIIGGSVGAAASCLRGDDA